MIILRKILAGAVTTTAIATALTVPALLGAEAAMADDEFRRISHLCPKFNGGLFEMESRNAMGQREILSLQFKAGRKALVSLTYCEPKLACHITVTWDFNDRDQDEVLMAKSIAARADEVMASECTN